MLQEAGFVNVGLVQEMGFNASPKTKGVLVRARKTERLDGWKREQIEIKFEIKEKSEDTKSGSG